jgi:hypothetical protein
LRVSCESGSQRIARQPRYPAGFARQCVAGETCVQLLTTFNTNGEYLVSEVIDFLELLGSDARLRHASNEEVKQALAKAGIAEPARATILEGDRLSLEFLLGAKANVFCGVVAPGEPDEEQDDEPEDDEPDDSEDDSEDE